MLGKLENPESGVSQVWEKEHDHYQMTYRLDKIKSEFQSATYEAFRRLALDEANADNIAADLELSTNAVYITRSRILKRLRKLVLT